jgi:tRNA threonylcarbamoyladenosine biosynthesis protein TsaE
VRVTVPRWRWWRIDAALVPIPRVSFAHRPILGTHTGHWPDESACAAAATALAQGAPESLADALITLDGPLGAGKTTFTRYLLRGLGITGRVRSPTFTLLESYDWTGPAGAARPVAVSHFDFYRFDDPHEWESAGFRDVFAAPGLKLVEWSSRAEGLMPTADLALSIEPQDSGARQATATAFSPAGLALLATWGAAPAGSPAAAHEPAGASR